MHAILCFLFSALRCLAPVARLSVRLTPACDTPDARGFVPAKLISGHPVDSYLDLLYSLQEEIKFQEGPVHLPLQLLFILFHKSCVFSRNSECILRKALYTLCNKKSYRCSKIKPFFSALFS